MVADDNAGINVYFFVVSFVLFFILLLPLPAVLRGGIARGIPVLAAPWSFRSLSLHLLHPHKARPQPLSAVDQALAPPTGPRVLLHFNKQQAGILRALLSQAAVTIAGMISGSYACDVSYVSVSTFPVFTHSMTTAPLNKTLDEINNARNPGLLERNAVK